MRYLSALLLALLFGCQKQLDQRPNILFILSDDHTAQAWGIYGGPLKDHVKNQNIQRLAQDGVVLNNAFCTNSICSPSRAAILTGQYSHLNQVYTLRESLPAGHPNIAKSLGASGYQTAIIGKWHLDKQPEGFDYFKVLPGQGRYWDPVFKTKDNWQDGYIKPEEGIIHQGFSTDVITDLTLKHLKKRDQNKPFMMVCSFKATHEPFEYPDRYKDYLKDVKLPEPASLYDFSPATTGRTFTGQKLENLGKRWDKATADPDNFWTSYPGLPYPLDGLDSIEKRSKIYQKLTKDFIRCGAAIDDNIGKILDYLDQEDIADNTIVIYTADQGYFLGEHGFFDKRLIYEESLRMPFVIRYPKGTMKGKRIDDIILNIDFAALLADYAGLPQQDYIQGKSFRQNLRGNTPADWRQQLYYRYWLHAPKRPAHFGLRNKRYKLALFYGKDLNRYGSDTTTTKPQWEFYDLETDPKELHNAIADPNYQEIIAAMKAQLKKERAHYGDLDQEYPEMARILQKELP